MSEITINDITQIMGELRILEENIGEEKEATKLTLSVAIQFLNDYRRIKKKVEEVER